MNELSPNCALVCPQITGWLSLFRQNLSPNCAGSRYLIALRLIGINRVQHPDGCSTVCVLLKTKDSIQEKGKDMSIEDEKSFCVKCGLETEERMFNLVAVVPFCSWCYQAFLGKARGDIERKQKNRR